MLFRKAGIITRFLLGIYDNSVYGYWSIVVVQTLTFFPVSYMMLKGLLKNIDPSLEEAARDMGASRWKVFTSVTLLLILTGIGNAFLVTFIESIADFANPMIIGGSYDTLATTIYLQITGAYDKVGAHSLNWLMLAFPAGLLPGRLGIGVQCPAGLASAFGTRPVIKQGGFHELRFTMAGDRREESAGLGGRYQGEA